MTWILVFLGCCYVAGILVVAGIIGRFFEERY